MAPIQQTPIRTPATVGSQQTIRSAPTCRARTNALGAIALNAKFARRLRGNLAAEQGVFFIAHVAVPRSADKAALHFATISRTVRSS